MKTKILILISALILLISLSGVSSYTPYPIYNYYDNYENIPIITGPYPREYLMHAEAGRTRFVHDDFNHYDDFIGYKDLDIFNPDGTINVIRNPYASELDLSQIQDAMQEMEIFGYHVHGVLPDGSTYRKHYHHDHPWDPGYGYFTPWLFYQNKPIYKKSCQSKSICQVTHGCC